MHKIKFLTQILKIIFQGTLDRPGCNHARLKKMQGFMTSKDVHLYANFQES